MVGALYRVLIDGKEMHPNAVTIKLRSDRPVEIELDLPIATVASFTGQATVVIPPQTEDTLISLGWRPPDGDVEIEGSSRD
jgi:hypothetical protein